MKVLRAVAVAAACLAIGQVALTAQGSAVGTAAARAVATGPTSAMTGAASAIRASRAAALAGRAAQQAAGDGIARSTQIMGYLWTANNGAITDASVQIRNTVTNVVESVTKTNAAGEFLFQNVNPGEYVIEYVTDSARSSLIAVGHPFTVSPGETVATFVRLSNGLPMLLPNELGNLTSNVATQAVTTAATEGVTAVATPLVQVVPPVVPPSAPPPAPPTVVSAIR